MDVFEARTAASPPVPSKAAVLAELRGRIRRMEGIGGADGAHLLPLGVPEVDRALPDGGLPLGCLHEIVGDPGDPFNVAATGFGTALLALIAQRRGQIVWITRGDDLHAPGLASYGLTPDRLITVRARRDADILWAMEEALRCRSLGAVLGEIGDIDMVASRRLQLAAESGGVTAFLLRGGETRARRLAATASVTRWRLASAPSAPLAGEPGLGAPRWRTSLLRCRGGRPGEWLLEWGAGAFGVVREPGAATPNLSGANLSMDGWPRQRSVSSV